MKKTYKTPETRIVCVEVAHMIANSPNDQLGIGGTTSTAKGAESRRGSIWDDDEE